MLDNSLKNIKKKLSELIIKTNGFFLSNQSKSDYFSAIDSLICSAIDSNY